MAIKENLPISAITAVSKKVSNVFFLIWTILASCFNTPLPPNIQGKFKLEHHHGPNRQSNHAIWQRMLTYVFLKGKYHCMTDLLFYQFGFSCLCCLEHKFTLFGQIRTSQTGGHLNSYTSPNEISQYYLILELTLNGFIIVSKCKQDLFFICRHQKSSNPQVYHLFTDLGRKY